MMKKTLVSLFLACILLPGLSISLFAGGKKADSGNTLTVGATPVPHAELLNLIKNDLAARGIELQVVEYDDYVKPNTDLLRGTLDANFFQHVLHLESNERWEKDLYPVFGLHVEPMGLYSTSYESLDELPEGALIAIPSSPANRGRALLLLHFKGLIILAPDAGVSVTPQDIIENPKNLRFQELEESRLPRVLGEVGAAVINGNFAIEAGLNPVRDSLIIEDAASPYINVVVVKKGFEDDGRIKALEEVLKTQKVRDFISARYDDGAVVPVF